MKTIYALFFLTIAMNSTAQDEDNCICMLDQPAYDVSLNQSVALSNSDAFSNLFNQQQTSTTEEAKLLIFLENYELEKDNFLEGEEEMESEAAAKRSFKSTIRKKNKHRAPRWNAHKKPKKYKGKCPFF